MGDVSIGWLVWVALAGGIAGCLVVQWWVAVCAIKLLCWEEAVGWPLAGLVLFG